ncbi:Peptidyl-prolyl cis-trans isomerase FKBP62 [Bienertia sinuspersici]
MAACFLRKKEFLPAGKLCTIVLELHPTSVKALFRRASATMVLGRLEFAVSDLKLAYEIEDLNKNPKTDMRDAMLKVEPPPRTVLNPIQFKVGGDTTTKLASVEEEKLKEETHKMI